MITFDQFRSLIGNIIKLYKNGCLLQQSTVFKNPILLSIERSIPILLTEAYGKVISDEIILYIKEESEYSLEEIYSVLDTFCRNVSKDSAIALWKLKEIYPTDPMIDLFYKTAYDRSE